MPVLRLLVLSCLFGLPLLASADDVYRWTDAQGSVNYGTKPPADARAIRKIDVDANVVPSEQATDQRLADSYSKSRQERLDRETADNRVAADKARAEAARLAAAAEAARAQAALDCSTQGGAGCADGGVYYPIVNVRRDPYLNGGSPANGMFNTPNTVPRTVPNTTPNTVPNTTPRTVPNTTPRTTPNTTPPSTTRATTSSTVATTRVTGAAF